MKLDSLKFVKAQHRHLLELGDNMFSSDEKTYCDRNSIDALDFMQSALDDSKMSYAVYYGSKLLIVFGLHNKKFNNKNFIWAAPDTNSNFKIFLSKISKEIIKQLRESLGTVYAFSSDTNPVGDRWLKLIGGKRKESFLNEYNEPMHIMEFGG